MGCEQRLLCRTGCRAAALIQLTGLASFQLFVFSKDLGLPIWYVCGQDHKLNNVSRKSLGGKCCRRERGCDQAENEEEGVDGLASVSCWTLEVEEEPGGQLIQHVDVRAGMEGGLWQSTVLVSLFSVFKGTIPQARDGNVTKSCNI